MNRLLGAKIVTTDVDGDAVLIELDEEPNTLIIRPGQTIESAARSVTRVSGQVDEDEVRRLVRDKMPDPIHFNETWLLTADTSVGRFPQRPERVLSPGEFHALWMILVLMVLLVAAGFTLVESEQLNYLLSH